MICDAGDVIIVPFPFVDAAIEKRRPAVVLSGASFNELNHHSIVLMITTAARSAWPSDVVIADLGSAGLSRACVMRWKVFTLPNARIVRQAGRLGQGDSAALAAASRGVFP